MIWPDTLLGMILLTVLGSLVSILIGAIVSKLWRHRKEISGKVIDMFTTKTLAKELVKEYEAVLNEINETIKQSVSEHGYHVLRVLRNSKAWKRFSEFPEEKRRIANYIADEIVIKSAKAGRPYKAIIIDAGTTTTGVAQALYEKRETLKALYKGSSFHTYSNNYLASFYLTPLAEKPLEETDAENPLHFNHLGGEFEEEYGAFLGNSTVKDLEGINHDPTLIVLGTTFFSHELGPGARSITNRAFKAALLVKFKSEPSKYKLIIALDASKIGRAGPPAMEKPERWKEILETANLCIITAGKCSEVCVEELKAFRKLGADKIIIVDENTQVPNRPPKDPPPK